MPKETRSRETLQLRLRLREIGSEDATPQERRAITEGRKAYRKGNFVSHEAWRHAWRLGDR